MTQTQRAPRGADGAGGTSTGPEGGEDLARAAAGSLAAPRRLRSSTVVLGGMGVLAMALAACGSDPDRRCVDRDSYTVDGYKILGSKDCKPSGGGKGKSAKAGGVTAARPAWYYDSDVHGSRASDGTFSRDGAIQRGGLGCDDDDDDGGSGGG